MVLHLPSAWRLCRQVLPASLRPGGTWRWTKLAPVCMREKLRINVLFWEAEAEETMGHHFCSFLILLVASSYLRLIITNAEPEPNGMQSHPVNIYWWSCWPTHVTTRPDTKRFGPLVPYRKWLVVSPSLNEPTGLIDQTSARFVVRFASGKSANRIPHELFQDTSNSCFPAVFHFITASL
jgi:hypothetical protein